MIISGQKLKVCLFLHAIRRDMNRWVKMYGEA